MDICKNMKRGLVAVLISSLTVPSLASVCDVSAAQKTPEEIVENSTEPRENIKFIEGDLDSTYVKYTYEQEGRTFMVEERGDVNSAVESTIYVENNGKYEEVFAQDTEIMSDHSVQITTNINGKTKTETIEPEIEAENLQENSVAVKSEKIQLGPWKSATYYGSKGISSRTLNAIKATLVGIIQAKVKPIKAGLISGLDSVASDIFKSNRKKVWYKEFYQYRTEKTNQFHITNDDIQTWWYSNSSRTKLIPPKTHCKRSFL